MTSLTASFAYERQQARLPPLDASHIAYMSKRRVEAEKAVYMATTERQRVAQSVAQRAARRQETELEAFNKIIHAREDGVRAARAKLLRYSMSEPALHDGPSSSSAGRGGRRPRTSPDAPVGPKLTTEAVREVTRDCVRRDELERRRAAAIKAQELAKAREEALNEKLEQERQRIAFKQEEEAKWLESKLRFEENRLHRATSSAQLKAQERGVMAALKETHEKKLAAERARHAKAKEDLLANKKAKAEQEEVLREQQLQKRRREKERIAQSIRENRAVELARKAEGVWHEAQAVLERCAQDYEAEATMAAAFSGEATGGTSGGGAGGSAGGGAGGGAGGASAQAMQLERLKRRLEAARLKAEAARGAFEYQKATASNRGEPPAEWPPKDD
jgi:hypothetical protein